MELSRVGLGVKVGDGGWAINAADFGVTRRRGELFGSGFGGGLGWVLYVLFRDYLIH